MSREIKKPAKVRESDLKDYAGDVVIDVTAKLPEVEPLPVELPAEAAAEEAAIQAVYTAPGAKVLSFAAWFQKALAKNPRIKLSYKEAIEAHCKAVGLSDQATEEAFDAALKHFGL